MKRHQYNSYADYIKQQIRTSKSKKGFVWAEPQVIEQICRAIKHADPRVILCQGARTGAEIKYFKKYLPKARITGTDLFPTGKGIIKMDFHDVKYIWKDQFDVVYSNSWDHLYAPEWGLFVWTLYIKPAGYLILESSDKHTDEGMSKSDPFALNHDEIVDYVSSINNSWMEYRQEIIVKSKKGSDRIVHLWQKRP
jgi:hypothetical protein